MRVKVPPWAEVHGGGGEEGEGGGRGVGLGRGFAVAPTAIIGGLAECVGLERLAVDGATGDYRTDLGAKARAAVKKLTEEGEGMGGEGRGGGWNFGLLHVKAVDDAGHDQRAVLKAEWLGRVDDMVGQVVADLNSAGGRGQGQGEEAGKVRYVVVVTGDHSTPVRGGDHSCEPVPVVMAEVGAKDGWEGAACDVRAFDEVACSRGVLGRFPGCELMPTIHRFCKLITGGGGVG